jgi:hypothetical protein
MRAETPELPLRRNDWPITPERSTQPWLLAECAGADGAEDSAPWARTDPTFLASFPDPANAWEDVVFLFAYMALEARVHRLELAEPRCLFIPIFVPPSVLGQCKRRLSKGCLRVPFNLP